MLILLTKIFVFNFVFFVLFLFPSFLCFFLTSDFKESLFKKIQITTSSTDKYLLPPSTLSVTSNCVSVISF